VVLVVVVVGVVVATAADVVVVFGAAGLLLLEHAAMKVANTTSTDPAVRRVTFVMLRMYFRPPPGQGRLSLSAPIPSCGVLITARRAAGCIPNNECSRRIDEKRELTSS
jgi:hypothetical protein